MDTTQLPYLSPFPGIQGQMKEKPEDFRVIEIPAYPFSGEGEHIYLEIEKKSQSTFALIKELSQKLKVPEKQIGYAGIKDTQAVTQQFFSVSGVSEAQVNELSLNKAKVVSWQRHSNKLKVGHLRGNRFEILLRELNNVSPKQVEEILLHFGKTGVPNYFGSQRFGNRCNNDEIGKALLEQKVDPIYNLILGEIFPDDAPRLQESKTFFQEGHYEKALSTLPRHFDIEGFLLRARCQNWLPEKILQRFPRRIKFFYLSAYQSALFNQTLAWRLPEIDTVWAGDAAMKHPGRSVFLVENEALEQPRANEREISPTGPIYGYKMLWAKGKQGEKEEELWKEAGLCEKILKEGHLKGERRSYRLLVENPSCQVCSEGIWIRFSLAKGCYATAVLRELMKNF